VDRQASDGVPPRTCGGWRAAILVALAVASFHVGLFIAVPFHRQDFALSDDWAYALGAFSFLRGDGPRYCEWSATPLVGQWLWSAPFVLIFGEDHRALRISTTVLHAAVAATLTLALSRLQILRAPLVAAAVAFHPLVCLAGVTYLTDVPTLAFAMIALGFWTLTTLRAGGFWGTVFGLLAVLNRQTALAAPAAILFGSLIRSPDASRRRWFGPILVLVVGSAVGLWFGKRTDIVNYPLRAPSVGSVLDVVTTALFFCGLGFLPVIAFLVPLKRLAIGSLAAAVLWSGWALAHHASSADWTKAAFPFAHNPGNLVTTQGSFGDAFTIGARPPLLGPATRNLWTAFAVIGAGGLLAAASLASSRRWRNPFVLFGLAHLALPVVSTLQFDRYYVPVLVGTAFLLPHGSSSDSRARWSAWCVLVVWIALSFALCRDWLTVNAAKWELGRRAVSSGVAVEEIEGGLEWDFHHAWRNGRPPKVATPRRQGFAVPFSLERLPHLTGRYAVSLGDDPRFPAVDRIAYQRWLPRRREDVVLLKAW
jgi:hypothetical protein